MKARKKDWWDKWQEEFRSIKLDAKTPQPGQIWRIPIGAKGSEEETIAFDYAILYVLEVQEKFAICTMVHGQEHLALLGDIDIPKQDSPLGFPLIVSCDLVQQIPKQYFQKGECFGEIKKSILKENIVQKIEFAKRHILSSFHSEDKKIFGKEGDPQIYLGLLPRYPRFLQEIRNYRASLSATLETLHPFYSQKAEMEEVLVLNRILEFLRKVVSSPLDSGMVVPLVLSSDIFNNSVVHRGIEKYFKSRNKIPRVLDKIHIESKETGYKFLLQLIEEKPIQGIDMFKNLNDNVKQQLYKKFKKEMSKVSSQTELEILKAILYAKLGDFLASENVFIDLLKSDKEYIAKKGCLWTELKRGKSTKDSFIKNILKQISAEEKKRDDEILQECKTKDIEEFLNFKVIDFLKKFE